MSKPTIEQLRDPEYLLYYWELEDGPEDYNDEARVAGGDVGASVDVCGANSIAPCSAPFSVCRSAGCTHILREDGE